MKSFRLLFFIITSFLFSQNQEATLHFKDGGESIKGYGEIYQGYKIKFKLDEEGETSIWTGDVVKGITFHEFERDINFEYQNTKNDQLYPLLLQVLVKGEVSLYADIHKQKIILPLPIENGLSLYAYNIPKSTKYYVKKTSDNYAIKFKGNFKKKVKEYFGECIGIEKRIKNHEFRWATLPELVEYYNNFCVDF